MLAKLDFAEAANKSYSFFLYDFCDNYIEFVKITLQDAAKASDPASLERTRAICHAKLDILYTCLDTSLKLMHPFLPFVTEELYQRLPTNSHYRPDSLVIAKFPTATDYNVWLSPQVHDCAFHSTPKSFFSEPFRFVALAPSLATRRKNRCAFDFCS